MNMLDSPIFELSPIAMWLEDFSEVKKQFDLWRAQGVQDLLTFLQEDESRILECAKKLNCLRSILKHLNFIRPMTLTISVRIWISCLKKT